MAEPERTSDEEKLSTAAPGGGEPGLSRKERRRRAKAERAARRAERQTAQARTLAARTEGRDPDDGGQEQEQGNEHRRPQGPRRRARTAEREVRESKTRKAARTKGLAVEGIDVHYGKVQALRNVSLYVEPGEMVALLGANGAGKSSTLRAISGMLAPTAGRITIDGEDITGLPAYEVVGKGVAHMPEGRELFPTLTVEENLRFGYYSKLKTDKAGYRDQLEHVFDLFPRLRERRGQAAGTMSGGEQQMLTAARAMMSKPRVLLVDELSLGLAPMIVSDLFAALHAVNKQGTAVLIVEQFIHLALEHTKRAYALAKGEMVLEGKSKDLAEDPELIEAYLGGEGGDGGEKNAANGAKDGASERKKSEAARKG